MTITIRYLKQIPAAFVALTLFLASESLQAMSDGLFRWSSRIFDRYLSEGKKQ